MCKYAQWLQRMYEVLPIQSHHSATTGVAPKVNERVEALLHVCPLVLAGMPGGSWHRDTHSQQSQPRTNIKPQRYEVCHSSTVCKVLV